VSIFNLAAGHSTTVVMAPNNALGVPTAAKMRAVAEGSSPAAARRGSKSPARKSEHSSDAVRVSSADGFGADNGKTSVLDRSEVTGRGTGTAIRTPLEEFEARPRNEFKNFFSGVMFLTRLPCPSWVDHHPGYLMRSMAYFPILGALIGVWAAAIYDASASLWPPLVAAAVSSGSTLWLTGCFHEDGLCDTLDGFGGGWTKSQILRIMRDSRNGSYATMGGGFWVIAKCAALAKLGELAGAAGSVWALGASVGAGPAIVVAQCVARASAAPLIYSFEYIVDDEDAKGEYYNWFGDSRRLLGLPRVLLALASATTVSYLTLPPAAALRVLTVGSIGTYLAGSYGKSVLGGVMGDFLGATICILEVAVYLAILMDVGRADAHAVAWLFSVVATPQACILLFGRKIPEPAKEC